MDENERKEENKNTILTSRSEQSKKYNVKKNDLNIKKDSRLILKNQSCKMCSKKLSFRIKNEIFSNLYINIYYFFVHCHELFDKHSIFHNNKLDG